jgi:hypothetical protein
MLEGAVEHIRLKDQKRKIRKHRYDGDERHHPGSEKHSASNHDHGISD